MKDRIEICGAIASGKTTLTQAFSKFGYSADLEDFTRISMLDDFYADPLSVSFETEISFTLQHYYQIKKALQGREHVIFDFSSVDDYAFALAILNEKEMGIYNQVFDYIIERIGKPQKLIRLCASTDELLLSIKNRGRQNEQGISSVSLLKFEESLGRAIERFYGNVPMVVVDTEEYSPLDYNQGFLEGLAH